MQILINYRLLLFSTYQSTSILPKEENELLKYFLKLIWVVIIALTERLNSRQREMSSRVGPQPRLW